MRAADAKARLVRLDDACMKHVAPRARREKGRVELRRKWSMRAIPPQTSWLRTRRLPLLAVAVCVLAGASLAHAAPKSANKPTPHTAPGARGPTKPPPPQPAKPLPIAKPQEPAPPPLAELPPLDTSVPPPMLPRASRERMRFCALEWEKRKMATKNGLPPWRDFAAKCLTQ